MFDFIRSRSFFDLLCESVVFAILVAVLLWSHPSISKTTKPTITASATALSRVAGVAKMIMGNAYWRVGYRLKWKRFYGNERFVAAQRCG